MKKIIAVILPIFSIGGFFLLSGHFFKDSQETAKPEIGNPIVKEVQAATSADSVKTYYVSDSGSDSNNGLTSESTLKSISKAVEMAKTGDTIKLSDGTILTVNKDSVNVNPVPVPAKPTCPAQVINLANWKQTLPIGSKGKPTEILQDKLATYAHDSCFHLNSACDGVVFRAPVNGVATSNSSYPRSELREMTNGGKTLAKWSTAKGTHTMFIDEAIMAVPKVKKHIVAGQVHNEDDDVIVIRLEYPKLFIDINGKTGPTLDPNYKLGKRFTVKFVAAGGYIKVYYNGSSSPAYSLKKNSSTCYFKAGAYTQSNCSKEKDCSSSNYGEVTIYKLDLKHEG